MALRKPVRRRTVMMKDKEKEEECKYTDDYMIEEWSLGLARYHAAHGACTSRVDDSSEHT